MLVVYFDPKGCPGRSQTRMIPIPARIPLNGWVSVSITVMPDFQNDCVTVDATFNGPGVSTSISRQAENFNFLPGKLYRLVLGMPAEGAAYIDDIRYKVAQNASLHVRRDDGLNTLWHMGMLDTSDRTVPPLINERRDGVVIPDFSQAMSPHAEMAVAYCDRVEFERIRIGAADRTLAQAKAYSEDTLLSFIVGDSTTVPGMGADLVAGLVGWGDARDIVKNLAFLWPGGRDPNWGEFGLAVCGLALDVSQPFTAGATTPANAFIACVKIMLTKLDPLIRVFPEAKRIAADLCELVMRVLQRLREMKILHLATAGFTVNELRKVVPPDLVDYLFAGLTEDHLKTFTEFGSKLTPSMNPFAPVGASQIATAFDAIANIQENAGRIDEMREIVELLVARIDLLAWFFNPNIKNMDEFGHVARGAREILGILGDVNPSAGLEATERLKRLLTDAEKWHAQKLKDVAPAIAGDPKFAKKAIAKTIKVIGKAATEHQDLFNDPVVVRGLTAFMAASGPVATGRLIKGFRLNNAGSRRRFAELMAMCDNAAELVSDVGARNNWSGAEVRQTLNRLWHGLALRKGVKMSTPLGTKIIDNSYNGALAELMAVSAFARAGLVHTTGHVVTLAFNPLRPKGTQLMDLLGAFVDGGVSAIEVKSISGSIDALKKRGINKILDQYERWVVEGFATNQGVKQFNYAVKLGGVDAAEKLQYLDELFEERYTQILARFLDPHDALRHKPPPVEIVPLDAMHLIS